MECDELETKREGFRIQIAEMAMRIEQIGETFYRQISEYNVHDRVKEVCRTLAQEEREHYETFRVLARSQLNDSGIREYDASVVEKLEQLILWIQEKTFRIRSVDIMTNTTGEVLDSAIRIEEALVNIYRRLYDIFADANREALEQIIAEERRHLWLLLKVEDLGYSKDRKTGECSEQDESC